MGTGMRVPSRGGGMGTAARTRQGTAQRQPGVGALTEVKVADRPMTMQGMGGMKTGSLGPKRQIYDKSYYMSELRKRCGDLAAEVTRMNKEINDIREDNQVYNTLEKRYDSLVKTVRALEGDLADYNLATDKQRTSTPPEEVHHMFMIMRQQNEQQRSDVDQIFLEKRSHEEEIQRMQQEIQGMTRAAEDRLNELHPDQRREYEDLRSENGTLGQEVAEARDELDQVNGRLNVVDGHLRSDMLRMRYQQLTGARKELMERLDGLEREVAQGSMSVPEQREILLNKVKTDNADIVAAEKRNSDLKLEKERLRVQINEVAADAKEQRDENTDHQKYEILFAKDQEMTQFIEGFNESKAEEEKKMRDKQDSVVQLLDNISKAATFRADVTPEGHLRDMEDELEFKNRQLQNSETTQNRLEAELAKRQGELEKIESLDVKISQELQQVEAKMRQYEEDIERKYDRVTEMKTESGERLRRFEARKQLMEGRASALRQQVGFLKLKHDSKRQQLADDESASNLEVQEQKIRQFGQTLQTLASFIRQKTAEADFSIEMVSCLDRANEINKILQTQKPAPMMGPMGA